jgi:RimJ/RimL family protein N-acetyltransferase
MLEPDYPIEAERLALRPFVADDFDALLDMHSREEVARYLYWGPRTAEDLRGVFDEKAAGVAIRAAGDSLSLAVARLDTGELVGDVALFLDSAEHRQGTIGFIIHPDHQRLGFATEACQALLMLGFDGLELHRVASSCDVRNEASAAVLQWLGMRREGHLVDDEFIKGKWTSQYLYAILDREWRETRAVNVPEPPG